MEMPMVIKNPSIPRKEPRGLIDGLIDMRVNSAQKYAMDGLIGAPSRNDSLEPVIAEGSAVGAPVVKKGSVKNTGSVVKGKGYKPKTKEVAGLVEPEPSRKF